MTADCHPLRAIHQLPFTIYNVKTAMLILGTLHGTRSVNRSNFHKITNKLEFLRNSETYELPNDVRNNLDNNR